jgi:hypothetical protein
MFEIDGATNPEHERQALAFCELYERTGAGEWEGMYSRWCESKGFGWEDQAAIACIVWQELVARTIISGVEA